jgi:Fe-Mn family superoxide dismutase
MQRRTFLKWSLQAGALSLLAMTGWGCSRNDQDSDQPIRLPPLPYRLDALEPYLSAETLSVHYGKHHRAYVNNTNRLLREAGLKKQPLVDILQSSYQPEACVQSALFNNAAQVCNHTFYWNSMKPKGGGTPQGLMADWIAKSFGSYETFRTVFAESALDHFASGWTWLVLTEGRLKVLSTANAVTPIAMHLQPLLVIDDWEHAYYLDYQNRRDCYVEAFLDHLVNWDFAAANLGKA